MEKRKKVLAVVGPTASGKTSLGVKLALALNGEVVSCDSMQVYRNMPIASAAPTTEETEGVPHHLVGFAGPETKFSVAEFIKKAEAAIDDIISRKKLPIIVGGTGLYVDSLISGINFLDEDSESVRAELEKEADTKGIEAMLELLREVDPETAAKYHINDRKRILRALEIYRIHGKPKSLLDRESKPSCGCYDCTWIGITYRNRDTLYERINRRVDIMLENGLLDEAKAAFLNDGGKTSVQAIGHKEFFGYFKGEMPLETAVENLKTETRHYAKRQLTWFRRNKEINWIYADETEDVLACALKITENS